jgi:hypothetical protein
VSVPYEAASAMAPTTPKAPASVGVARPMKMVPNTRKIRPSEGMMPRRHFFHSAQPLSVRASSGRAGTSFGHSTLTIATQPQNSAS